MLQLRGGLPPLQEDLVAAPVGEAGPPDAEVLHQAQVLDLVADQDLIKPTWGDQSVNRGARGLTD